MAIQALQRNGKGILVKFDDGTRIDCYPTPTGIWIPRRGAVAPDPEPDLGDPPPDPGGDSPWKWPMNPDALNTRNGRPQDGYMTPERPTHNGVDMSFPPTFYDGMPVRTIADGVVHRAYWEPGGGGYAVEIRHSSRWMSGYYHGRAGSFKVANGEPVTQGQPLMDAGESGTATGPHVHLMVVDLAISGSYWSSHTDPEAFMATYNPNDEYV